MTKSSLHPAVQSMIERGVFSFEPVAGWQFCFLDGVGWGVSGWTPPPTPPEFPPQDDRRSRRVDAGKTLVQVAEAIGVHAAAVSGFERGRIEFSDEMIVKYDAYISACLK